MLSCSPSANHANRTEPPVAVAAAAESTHASDHNDHDGAMPRAAARGLAQAQGTRRALGRDEKLGNLTPVSAPMLRMVA